MIIVTGASGRLGSQVVTKLLDRVPAASLGVSVRDVSTAAALADRGVRVRAGDFTEPESLKHAFEDADQVLVISASIRGPQAAAASKAAIDAAVAAGASRVLYTSHQMASRSSQFAAAREHARAEAHLAVQDVAFTALRHGFYTSTFEYYLPAALQTGELRLPEDGPVSWTAHDDLAEADAIALTNPGVFPGATPTLTASELLDFADVARLVTELTGQTIKRIVVDDEEWKAHVTAQGMPADAAEFMLGMFRAARAGEMAVTDPALESVLGRPSTPARAVIESILR
ncbi:NAD(P)H-binding protein [Kribbella albertanoniae]|uniref:NAD-dependent epimerase/dehydratase family protein n=1 Tax=Kribbella albertanoniae TaxID=1266829 RepID=A0A4R4PS03_9ACTN|nr:NAD(P)H-binding protein [Kribbella albertanoniae]TDC25058.1 NAD-dependent epimerase/dehydratase family protein [Kribbella albertanoniae]